MPFRQRLARHLGDIVSSQPLLLVLPAHRSIPSRSLFPRRLLLPPHPWPRRLYRSRLRPRARVPSLEGQSPLSEAITRRVLETAAWRLGRRLSLSKIGSCSWLPTLSSLTSGRQRGNLSRFSTTGSSRGAASPLRLLPKTRPAPSSAATEARAEVEQAAADAPASAEAPTIAAAVNLAPAEPLVARDEEAADVEMVDVPEVTGADPGAKTKRGRRASDPGEPRPAKRIRAAKLPAARRK